MSEPQPVPPPGAAWDWTAKDTCEWTEGDERGADPNAGDAIVEAAEAGSLACVLLDAWTSSPDHGRTP